MVLTLARPPVNALNLSLVEAIIQGVVAARDDASCAAVVLAGQPGCFSAGIDIKEVPSYTPQQRGTMLRAVNRMVLELHSLPKPLVAAIGGHALGGGLVLALTADLRLLARGDHRLGLTEAKAGIPFPAGAQTVVEAELSPSTRRRLCLTAASLPPDDPWLDPVVDRRVEPEQLVSEATREASSMAALPGHAAVKQQLRAATVERLRQIVEQDDEPLLKRWI